MLCGVKVCFKYLYRYIYLCFTPCDWKYLGRERVGSFYWPFYFSSSFWYQNSSATGLNGQKQKHPLDFIRPTGIWYDLTDLWMTRAFLFTPVCLLSKYVALRMAEATRNKGTTLGKSSSFCFCFFGWPVNDSGLMKGLDL